MSYSRIHDFRNLFLVENKFASAGKDIIDGYLNDHDIALLIDLLKHHTEIPVPVSAAFQRPNVDYFIEYFTMLSIGHLTGYLERKDIEEVQAEIAYYLGNAPIKRYYYVNYPLLFPQLLLEMVMQKKFFDAPSPDDRPDRYFETFHLLNQTINNDEFNYFLSFLAGCSGFSAHCGLLSKFNVH